MHINLNTKEFLEFMRGLVGVIELQKGPNKVPQAVRISRIHSVGGKVMDLYPERGMGEIDFVNSNRGGPRGEGNDQTLDCPWSGVKNAVSVFSAIEDACNEIAIKSRNLNVRAQIPSSLKNRLDRTEIK